MGPFELKPLSHRKYGRVDELQPFKPFSHPTSNLSHIHPYPFLLPDPGQLGFFPAPFTFNSQPQNCTGTRFFLSQYITWPNHCNRCSLMLSLIAVAPRFPSMYSFSIDSRSGAGYSGRIRAGQVNFWGMSGRDNA